MKGLIVKPKWADFILDGFKTIEIRGKKTNIRGKIGIIKSGSKKVFGTVELFHCVELNKENFEIWKDRHKVDCKFEDLSYKRSYAWFLTKVKKFDKAIPYNHKKGCVIWVNI